MQLPGATDERGIIAWFAANHVAANLLMLVIIVAGLISAFTIRKETQPDIELNMIQVEVAYLGAAPQEVEEGVVADCGGLPQRRGAAEGQLENHRSWPGWKMARGSDARARADPTPRTPWGG